MKLGDTLDETLKKALEIVVPDEEEVKKGKKAERIIRERLDKILEGRDIEYEFVGSYARNTWLKGNLEIDVFLLFPESYSMDELEKIGIEIGKAVVDDYELRYAAHPYVHGFVEGVEVDVVPCYKVKDPSKIKSAVDRTPFHHRWLKDRVKGKENEIRLLKGFLKAGGIYGAEYKVKGFSGYLCELLVVFFGSFLETVERGKKLSRRDVIDIRSGKIKKGEKFFVVDPVDEKRNVAANLSVDNLARFVQRCRQFLKNPSLSYFLPPRLEIERDEIERELDRRYVLCFTTYKPEIVEDNLYTQLERAGRKIFEHLERLGFKPLREHHFSDGKKCYVLVETEVRELSVVEKRLGPPFEDEKNVEKFLRKCKEKGEKPFIENGRFYTYSERKLRRAASAVIEFASKEWKAFGKNLGECVKEEFSICEGREILKLAENREFEVNVAKFLGLIPDIGGVYDN